MGIRSTIRITGIGLLCLTLGACTPSYRNHGYMPPEDVLDQIVVGVDTRASVEETAALTPLAWSATSKPLALKKDRWFR